MDRFSSNMMAAKWDIGQI
jgi:hypothetical protein